MNKIFSFAAGALMLLPMVAGATVNADACDQQFSYTKQGDFSDSRLVIDVTTINAQNNDEKISISAQAGYEVIEVNMDVDQDGHAGFWNYSNGPLTDFNPNPGTDITIIKVTVRKTCAVPPPVDVCADIAGDQATVPVGYHQDGPNCPIDVVVPPVDLCPNDAGVQITTPCPSDTATTTPPVSTTTPPVVEPTPPSPSSSHGSNNGGSQGGHRHCDVPGQPSCAVFWGQTGTGTPSSILDQLKAIQDLMAKILTLFARLNPKG